MWVLPSDPFNAPLFFSLRRPWFCLWLFVDWKTSDGDSDDGGVFCGFVVQRFQYVLQAATSPATLFNEETQTYLNQGIATPQRSFMPATHGPILTM